MWYVSIMSKSNLLVRITRNKASTFGLACHVLLLATVVSAVDVVAAGPLKAEPKRAKEVPEYVGDFYGSEVGRQVEIVDDGPAIIRPYMHAPAEKPSSVNKAGLPLPEIRVEDKTPVIQLPSEGKRTSPASLQRLEAQGQRGLIGRQYAAARSERERTRLTPGGAIGDFPLPKPNFPREIGPAGKFAIPMTASPSMVPAQAKPMRATGAAQRGDASRPRKPTNPRASAVPIQTYSSGYVPGSAFTDGKPNGCKLRAR